METPSREDITGALAQVAAEEREKCLADIRMVRDIQRRNTARSALEKAETAILMRAGTPGADTPPTVPAALRLAASAMSEREKVAELVADGSGYWRACSGCQEATDGQINTADYPFSDLFQCHPGGGCHECGGIGVIWHEHRGDHDDGKPISPWRSMETAPRDGTRALLSINGGVSIGREAGDGRWFVAGIGYVRTTEIQGWQFLPDGIPLPPPAGGGS